MKERKDCKIVQDLLPNYIEHLTSEETNKYIEEHLATCEECKKILKNMQKEMKTDGEKIDGREVDYIKKYNKKLKVIKNVQIVVLTLLLLYMTTVVVKLIILRDISSKQAKFAENKGNNVHVEVRTQDPHLSSKTDIYHKDGKDVVKSEYFRHDPSYMAEDEIIYTDEIENIRLDLERKSCIINDGFKVESPIKQAPKRDFIDDLKYAMFSRLEKTVEEGVEAYILKENGQRHIVDKETGQIIKTIDAGFESVVKIEYDIVTDEDVKRPDLTGYTIQDYRQK